MAAGFIIFESGMEMMPDQFTGISGSMSPSHVSVCSVVLMVSVTQALGAGLHRSREDATTNWPTGDGSMVGCWKRSRMWNSRPKKTSFSPSGIHCTLRRSSFSLQRCRWNSWFALPPPSLAHLVSSPSRWRYLQVLINVRLRRMYFSARSVRMRVVSVVAHERFQVFKCLHGSVCG